jgi:hypothetical protein
VGNLPGEPLPQGIIGADVEGVFEHHAEATRRIRC